ncbi:MAG: formate transporter FocA [Pseudomonadota bacterium]
MSNPTEGHGAAPNMDSLLPREMALKAEQVGMAKAAMDFGKMFTLAVLAGAFIALGAVFSTTVTAGAQALPLGVARLLGGLTFCLGLILVIVAGAELFTGNTLMVMAWAGGRVKSSQLLRNWVIVYLGNLAGAWGTAALVLAGEQYTLGGGAVGLNALNLAQGKCAMGFLPALALGVLCNTLVCLAVWLCYSARTVTDRVLAIIFPITAFVTSGFEHSVANMYFISVGLGIKGLAGDGFWRAIGRAPADFSQLTWHNFLWVNLLPVTLGNIIGGTVLVGLVYWFVFLRSRPTAR